MRIFLSIFMVALLTFGFLINDAQAKRFGGGRSFGIQRSTSSFSRVAEPIQTPFAQRAASTASPTNRWLGPLMGFAAGGLLASLFMGKGIMSGLFTWIALAVVVMMALRFFQTWQQSRQMPLQSTDYQAFNQNRMQEQNSLYETNQPFSQPQQSGNYPIGFDQETFLREAKVQFIRLQTAYDLKNLNDLRQFTTPEVFGEIQLQLHERGDAVNQTEVVQLNAQLVDVSRNSSDMVASVHFTGLVREDNNQAPTSLSEIWNFKKDAFNGNWLVAGIQQNG